MPQRINTLRFDTSDVQGEGSYIIVRSMTMGEVVDFQRRAMRDRRPLPKLRAWLDRVFRRTQTAAEQGRADAVQTLGFVRGWNWVDDDGKPLPLPADDPGVIDRLVIEELTCIANCVNGRRQSEERKN